MSTEPTVAQNLPDNTQENKRIWETYDWPQAGDEWSGPWGGSGPLWHGFIMPRLWRFLPATRAVEIAPGFGRCTQYLKHHCEELVLVDLVEKCIEACKARFRDDDNLDYIVNDGETLPGVADGSVDLVFSWDSLVHVDYGPMRSYVREIARVLRPGGVALLHHSNLGMHEHELGGIDPNAQLGNRRVSVSAAKIARDAREAGLGVVVQELLPWNDARFHNDCVSLLVNGQGREPDDHILKREDFGAEIEIVSRVAERYRTP